MEDFIRYLWAVYWGMSAYGGVILRQLSREVFAGRALVEMRMRIGIGYRIRGSTSAVAAVGTKTYLRGAPSGGTIDVPLVGTELKATRKMMDLAGS